MNKQLDEVMRRRGELLTKITGQREQMTEIGSHVQTKLALVDKGLAAVRHLRSNPAWVAGAAALLMFRRHGAFDLAKGAWLMWKRYRSIASLSSRL